MAQAILLKDVDALGDRGDVIDVSPGYLRNFLVPRKLAQPATPAAIAETLATMAAVTTRYERRGLRIKRGAVRPPSNIENVAPKTRTWLPAARAGCRPCSR